MEAWCFCITPSLINGESGGHAARISGVGFLPGCSLRHTFRGVHHTGTCARSAWKNTRHLIISPEFLAFVRGFLRSRADVEVVVRGCPTPEGLFDREIHPNRIKLWSPKRAHITGQKSPNPVSDWSWIQRLQKIDVFTIKPMSPCRTSFDARLAFLSLSYPQSHKRRHYLLYYIPSTSPQYLSLAPIRHH